MDRDNPNRSDKWLIGLKRRIDEFGYGMFLLVILGITILVIQSYGWRMGAFSAILMLAVLELAYQLYARR
jgi:hypothetical protein